MQTIGERTGRRRWWRRSLLSLGHQVAVWPPGRRLAPGGPWARAPACSPAPEWGVGAHSHVGSAYLSDEPTEKAARREPRSSPSSRSVLRSGALRQSFQGPNDRQLQPT